MDKTVSGLPKLSKQQKSIGLLPIIVAMIKRCKGVAPVWIGWQPVTKLHDGFLVKKHHWQFFNAHGHCPEFFIDGPVLSLFLWSLKRAVWQRPSSAAKFWQTREDFLTRIIDTQKWDHIGFHVAGTLEVLQAYEAAHQWSLVRHAHLTANMETPGVAVWPICFCAGTGDGEPTYQSSWQSLILLWWCREPTSSMRLVETHASCPLKFGLKSRLTDAANPWLHPIWSCSILSIH